MTRLSEERIAIADRTPRDRRAAELRKARARETDAHYTVFSNDFDPLLRTPNLTLGQAIRVLQSGTGRKVLFKKTERGLGAGFQVAKGAKQIAPTAGCMQLDASAETWNRMAAKCGPQELEDLKTYGAQMRSNIVRD